MELQLLIFGAVFLFGLISIANVIDQNGRGGLWFDVALFLAHALALLIGFTTALLPPAMTAETLISPSALAIPFFVAGGWGALVALRPFRRLLAAILPLNPRSAVQALALAFSGYLVAFAALALQDGLEAIADSAGAAQVSGVVLQGVVFVLLALSGVGLLIRRGWPETMARLGLGRLTGRQVGMGLAWIVVLVILQAIGGGLWAALNPEQAGLVESVNAALLADIDTVGEWLLLAVSAGVGEEILFRGALQPVFGIWLTAALFAVPHVQYGFTPVTAVIFIIGVILGYIRRRENTSMVIFIHFGYNFALGLFSLLATALQNG